eukprot:scaffold9941_cov116-Isochrysis_galbana.AAC.6
MAPRQLQLELNEVDMLADKGSKRVRVERAYGIRELNDAGVIACPSDRLCHLLAMPCALLALPDHWPELRLLARVVSAAKDTFGCRSTPQYYHSSGCPLQLQHPSGQLAELTTATIDLLIHPPPCPSDVVSTNKLRPFPTHGPAELAGEDPAVGANVAQSTEGQACAPLARRTLHCALDHTITQQHTKGYQMVARASHVASAVFSIFIL